MSLLALLLGGCAPPAGPLRVGTNAWAGYAPLYAARAAGLLGDDVQLVELTSATEVQRAYRGGAVDAAALTFDEVLVLAHQGVPVRVVLVLDVSTGGDAILAGAWANGIGDLRGRRVGVETTAAGAYLLARALAAAQLPRDTIAVVPLEAHEHEQAFRRGEVDAVVTFEPMRSRLTAAGARELFSSRDVPGEIVDVLVVSPAALAARPRAVAHLAGAWFHAVEALARSPSEAAARMAPQLRLAPAEALAALDGIHFPTRAENVALLAGTSPGLLTVATTLTTAMRQAELLRDAVDVAGLLAGDTVSSLP